MCSQTSPRNKMKKLEVKTSVGIGDNDKISSDKHGKGFFCWFIVVMLVMNSKLCYYDSHSV